MECGITTETVLRHRGCFGTSTQTRLNLQRRCDLTGELDRFSGRLWSGVSVCARASWTRLLMTPQPAYRKP